MTTPKRHEDMASALRGRDGAGPLELAKLREGPRRRVRFVPYRSNDGAWLLFGLVVLALAMFAVARFVC